MMRDIVRYADKLVDVRGQDGDSFDEGRLQHGFLFRQSGPHAYRLESGSPPGAGSGGLWMAESRGRHDKIPLSFG
jgi:hypothetical protein